MSLLNAPFYQLMDWVIFKFLPRNVINKEGVEKLSIVLNIFWFCRVSWQFPSFLSDFLCIVHNFVGSNAPSKFTPSLPPLIFSFITSELPYSPSLLQRWHWKSFIQTNFSPWFSVFSVLLYRCLSSATWYIPSGIPMALYLSLS